MRAPPRRCESLSQINRPSLVTVRLPALLRTVSMLLNGISARACWGVSHARFCACLAAAGAPATAHRSGDRAACSSRTSGHGPARPGRSGYRGENRQRRVFEIWRANSDRFLKLGLAYRACEGPQVPYLGISLILGPEPPLIRLLGWRRRHNQ